jgi:hypothetical protein
VLSSHFENIMCRQVHYSMENLSLLIIVLIKIIISSLNLYLNILQRLCGGQVHYSMEELSLLITILIKII